MIRVITDNDELKVFKTYGDAAEYFMNAQTMISARKRKGNVTIHSKEEFDRLIKSL